MVLPPEKTTRLRYDGIETYLALQLDPLESSTTITFAAALATDGGISNVPTLGYDEYMTLSILTPNYVLKEIVYLISYTQGQSTGTITRAEEGSGLATHAVGAKVVHSPTAVDFGDLAAHMADPNAHHDAIQTASSAAASAAVAAHVGATDPHTQYVKKGAIEVKSGESLQVRSGGSIFIAQGANITVAGDLIIQSTGRLFINGKQIIISNTAPPTPLANTVWIKTFG